LKKLTADETHLEADLLVHLGEVEARGLALQKGFPSLFAYCVEVLHFSEWAAYHRIAAARAVREFPLVLERVRSGEIHLSGLRLLLPHLNAGNCRELLDLARHRSKRAIEESLADRAPKPDVLAQVRRLPEPVAGPGPDPGWPMSSPVSTTVAPVLGPSPLTVRPALEHQCDDRDTSERASPQPLGASRYKVQFTARPELHAKLVEAQALLRHQIPDGDLARVFERALDALLRDARRAKFAETDRPRAAHAGPSNRPGPASRYIPAAIRREVAARDGRRCTYVARDGRRCEARDGLEFHHEVPFARSRQHRAFEITLRCRAHNALAANVDFGTAHMARFRRDRVSTVTCPGASSRPRDGTGPARSRDQPPDP
jgi:hypothetical protein